MMKLYVRAWMFNLRLKRRINKLFNNEEGATIAEYAILLAVVVVSLIAILGRLGGALEGKIETIINQIDKTP